MSEQKKTGQFDVECKDRGIYKGCGQTITMKKEEDGWHAYNKDGTRHKHGESTEKKDAPPKQEGPDKGQTTLNESQIVQALGKLSIQIDEIKTILELIKPKMI